MKISVPTVLLQGNTVNGYLWSYRYLLNCRVACFNPGFTCHNCTAELFRSNPFKNEANASRHDSDIQDGDTLEIFSTETLTIKFLARNLLQKCSLYVKGNRFFSDTSIDFNKDDFFKCGISFYDTGQHQIKLISIRNSGEMIHQVLNVFVVSHLFQPDIKAKVGDSVTLSASGVNDKGVYYVWRFFDGDNNDSDSTINFKLKSTSGPEGFLAVWDRKEYYSPWVKFRCEINDYEPPAITCLNELFKDTVVAHDSNFYFIVRVEDESRVKEVVCNSVSADQVLQNNNYVWLIKRVDTLMLPAR